MRLRQGSDLRERGSLTLELAILTPAVLTLLGLVILAGRVEVAASAVDQAAAAAARAASLARTPQQAQDAATTTANQSLTDQDLTCAALTVTVTTAGFDVPVGQPADVAVRVSCTISLSGLGVPGMPASRTLTSTTTSPLDTYRSR